jgi:hypothetical protein
MGKTKKPSTIAPKRAIGFVLLILTMRVKLVAEVVAGKPIEHENCDD